MKGESGLQMSLISDSLRSSSAPALYDAHHGQGWTYCELSEVAQRTAKLLVGKKKALFFLFCRNDAASVIGYLAAMDAGHAVAVLDEELTPEFKKKLIDLYQPEFVLSSVPTATVGIEEMEGTYSQTAIGDPPLYVWSSDAERLDTIYPELALLLATSSGMGSPKFARLSKSNLASSARAICAALRITGSDKPITSLPMHSSYGLSVINSHLMAGAEIVVTDLGMMTSDFWNVFRERNCTSWAGVPYSYELLKRLDLEQLNVPSLRTLTQAGGKLDAESAVYFHEFMRERGGQFYVMYGQTEATAQICVLPSERLLGKLGSCGQAIDIGALAIESEVGLTNEPGITGEVFYRGPNVMLGYAASREDLKSGDELHGMLATGDLGHLDGDGYLFLTGRRKRDAKVLGRRLDMDEVEEILRPHGRTAVAPGKDKLIVYCEHGDEQAFGEYAQQLSSRLQVPVRAFEFRRVETLPVEEVGG